MTTIAYRQGVLAADTLTSWNGEVVSRGCTKIGKAGRLLFAADGDAAWGWKFRDWVRAGCRGDHPEPDDNSGGLIIMPDETVLIFHSKGVERRLVPFAAAGSGCDYALGAMQYGATAVEAVKCAMEWDRKTGGEITALRR